MLAQLLGAPVTGRLHGQDVRTLPRGLACLDCTILIEPDAVLGADRGPGFVGYTNTIASDGERYFLTFHRATDEIRVFDSRGRFLRLLGRPGPGPGEYRRVTGLSVGPGDNLHVLADGRILLHGRSSSGSGEVQLLDAEGEILRSIRDQNAASEGVGRWFADAPDGGFWIAHFDRYMLDRRTFDGDLLFAIQGSADWFRWPEGEGAGVRSDGTIPPPGPAILDIAVDPDGLVWIVGKTPHPEWERSLDETRRRILRPELHWATVIEVIDPSGPAVVARRIVEGPDIRGFVGPGRIFTYVETPQGEPRIQMSTIQLRR